MTSGIPITVRFIRQMRSQRSSKNGIHPSWLSEKASLSFGKRARCPENSQSDMESCAWKVLAEGGPAPGASGEVMGCVDDEPIWRQITVSVSAQASMNGSQCPSDEWMLGSPRAAGSSLNVTARH